MKADDIINIDLDITKLLQPVINTDEGAAMYLRSTRGHDTNLTIGGNMMIMVDAIQMHMEADEVVKSVILDAVINFFNENEGELTEFIKHIYAEQ
jgi:hypothetical protein